MWDLKTFITEWLRSHRRDVETAEETDPDPENEGQGLSRAHCHPTHTWPSPKRDRDRDRQREVRQQRGRKMERRDQWREGGQRTKRAVTTDKTAGKEEP